MLPPLGKRTVYKCNNTNRAMIYQINTEAYPILPIEIRENTYSSHELFYFAMVRTIWNSVCIHLPLLQSVFCLFVVRIQKHVSKLSKTFVVRKTRSLKNTSPITHAFSLKKQSHKIYVKGFILRTVFVHLLKCTHIPTKQFVCVWHFITVCVNECIIHLCPL